MRVKREPSAELVRCDGKSVDHSAFRGHGKFVRNDGHGYLMPAG
jgi:hypothetical protein